MRPSKHKCPWVTYDICQTIKKRNRIHKRFLRHRTLEVWNEYKEQRNLVVTKLRTSKKEYFTNLVKNNANPSTIWKVLKSSYDSNTKIIPSSAISEPTETASKFNDHFRSTHKSTSSDYSTHLLPLSTSPACTTQLALQPITDSQCLDLLNNLNMKKASGIDGIPSSALKQGAPAIAYPIAKIINYSIQQNSVPSIFKQAIVTPIYKDKDQDSVDNYRPISVLPSISRVLEKAISLQLMSHLEVKNLLYKLQSGYRPSHSTQTLLLFASNNWYMDIDKGLYVGVIFVDLHKAFDSIDIPMLINKLHSYGLTNSTISWLTSYLSNRSQAVSINGHFSSLEPISTGVPQGSILGPLLFSLFINDLPQSCSDSSTIMYADDTAIYISSKDPSTLSTSLQSALNNLLAWLSQNKLTLNATKTKCMLIRPERKQAFNLNITIDNLPIEQVNKFKYLGVWFNETLSWSDHTQYVQTKVSKKAHQLQHLSWFLPKATLTTFYKAYILPIFDYGDVVWNGCSSTESLKLERLQNYCARIILKRRRFSSASQNKSTLG